MRIFFSKNKNDKTLNVIQKIILYIVVLLLYIIINSQLDAEFGKIMAFLITIYFAWDRIFSISKEIKQIIIEQSVIYYYEEDNISSQELNEMYIDYKFIGKNIEENKLIIQIMIRLNFLMYKNLITENFDLIRLELFKLCNLYHSAGYFSYTILVRYHNVNFNKDRFKDDGYTKEVSRLFKDIEEKDKQEAFPIEAIIAYINEMYNNNEFDKVKSAYVKYLDIYIKTLNIEVLRILRDTFNKLEDANMVDVLNKLIEK